MSASHLVHMHVPGFMPGEIFCSVQSSVVILLNTPVSQVTDTPAWIILGKQIKLPTDPVIQWYYTLIRQFLHGLGIFLVYQKLMLVLLYAWRCLNLCVSIDLFHHCCALLTLWTNGTHTNVIIGLRWKKNKQTKSGYFGVQLATNFFSFLTSLILFCTVQNLVCEP